MRVTSTRYLMLLIMLISIAQCGLSLYLPSLPAISSSLNVLPALVQLTVVYYVIGIGISQLFYGPLSDHYGRKKTVLFGVYIFFLGTVLAAFSKTIDILLVARFIQGVGIGAATTISRAVLRDIFQGKEYVKAGSKLASAVATAPIVAPILGGYIQANLGWRANFFILLILTAVILVCWHILFRETNHQRNAKNIMISLVIKNYLSIIRSSVFLKNVICGGLIYSGEVVFLSMAPFLMQVKLGVSASVYGWLLFLTISGFMAGARTSSYLANKISCSSLVFIGILFSSLASLMMLIFGMINYFNLISLILPMILFMFGAGFVYPNTSVIAVGKFSDKAGTASALLSSLQGLLAALSGILVSLLHSNTLLAMAAILFGLCIFSWFSYYPTFGLGQRESVSYSDVE